jgi:ferredoxin
MPRVSIADTSKTFDVNEGETLYNSLVDQGEDLPHGCLSGSCGACRIEIISGKENLLPPSFIELNTIEALREEFRQSKGDAYVNDCEIRLSCRAKVLGEIVFRPIK